MNSQKMAYDINEMPPLKESIILAFQHLFAMFGATILVPILVLEPLFIFYVRKENLQYILVVPLHSSYQ